jgi:rare lipoprotein A
MATRYTVRGKTYAVLKSAKGFVQRGIASWYGERFHGRKTASGETYDMFAFTAAHKTLPLGTRLRVFCPSTGNTIEVEVNDRGPFHGDRILDLSFAAARRLGFARQGTALVLLEAID